MHHTLGSTPRCFRLALTAIWLVACSGSEEPGGGAGGAPSASGAGGAAAGSLAVAGSATVAGTSSIAGASGVAGSPGFGGVANTGGSGVAGALGSAGISGAASGGTSSGAGGTAGSPSKGGAGGALGGAAGASGAPSGGKGGEAGTAGSGTGGGGAGGPEFGSGAERKLGYLGCSMSQNVAQGYATLGGKRLWPVMQAYGAQVVQNWARDGGPWTANGGFDSGVQQFGQPDAVWIMLCIFSNMVTIQEAKQIIALARQHAPNAKLYITGQPLNSGTDCNLAGNGGAELTDRIAKQAAMEDPTVTYAGTFGPLTPQQRSDGCHANDAGQRLLGQQVIDKWGK